MECVSEKANPAWAGNSGVTPSPTDRDRISASSSNGTRDTTTNTKATHHCILQQQEDS